MFGAGMGDGNGWRSGCLGTILQITCSCNVTDMEPRKLVFLESLLNLLIHFLLCWPMVNVLQ